MPVPDYQTLMAPALQVLADGVPRPMRELRDLVATHVGLSEEDRRETIASGMAVIDNRVHWAVTYLFQAGLVRRPRRAVVEITERGRTVLKSHPDRVDNRILIEFEEFRDFKTRSRARGSATGLADDHEVATPREKVADAVEEANAAVAAGVLQRVQGSDPSLFEKLVLRVLVAMGYGERAGSSERLGGVGDAGVDGVIHQDALGLDQIYVQAKRYASDRTIGRPDMQAFVGGFFEA